MKARTSLSVSNRLSSLKFSNIESENVVLELSDPTRPGLFLPFENEDNDEDLLMLLMPMMV